MVKPFYFGGEGVLISDTKYVFIRRTFEYIYKAVFNIKTEIAGINTVNITDPVLDKTASTFQFSEDDPSCDILSSIAYTYEQLDTPDRCDSTKSFISRFTQSVIIASQIDKYLLILTDNRIRLKICINLIDNFLSR